MTQDLKHLAKAYRQIEAAILFIDRHSQAQPDLSTLARHLHLSESHCQRLFSDWVGISPKRFLQFLTLQHTKALLREADNVLVASADGGLSSVSRIHDLHVQCEAVTPGEHRRHGDGMTLYYGVHATPFGECVVACSARGLCGLRFVLDDNPSAALDNIKANWPRAQWAKDPGRTGDIVNHIFAPQWNKGPLYANVKGTNFQIQVWTALLKIPQGKLVSYRDLAHFVGAPRASRAVANAVAHNPIHFLIPCHRVIRSLGHFGGYQGHDNSPRKKAMHVWEAANTAQQTTH